MQTKQPIDKRAIIDKMIELTGSKNASQLARYLSEKYGVEIDRFNMKQFKSQPGATITTLFLAEALSMYRQRESDKMATVSGVRVGQIYALWCPYDKRATSDRVEVIEVKTALDGREACNVRFTSGRGIGHVMSVYIVDGAPAGYVLDIYSPEGEPPKNSRGR